MLHSCWVSVSLLTAGVSCKVPEIKNICFVSPHGVAFGELLYAVIGVVLAMISIIMQW